MKTILLSSWTHTCKLFFSLILAIWSLLFIFWMIFYVKEVVISLLTVIIRITFTLKYYFVGRVLFSFNLGKLLMQTLINSLLVGFIDIHQK